MNNTKILILISIMSFGEYLAPNSSASSSHEQTPMQRPSSHAMTQGIAQGPIAQESLSHTQELLPNTTTLGSDPALLAAIRVCIADRFAMEQDRPSQLSNPLYFDEHGHVTVPENLIGLTISVNPYTKGKIAAVRNFSDLCSVLSYKDDKKRKIVILSYGCQFVVCGQRIALFRVNFGNLHEEMKKNLDLNTLLGNELPANERLVLEGDDIEAFLMKFVLALVKASQDYESEGVRQIQEAILDFKITQ